MIYTRYHLFMPLTSYMQLLVSIVVSTGVQFPDGEGPSFSLSLVMRLALKIFLPKMMNVYLYDNIHYGIARIP